MQTNFNAAAAISSGQLDLVVSAGVEMMSRVPMGSNGGSLSDEVTSRHEIVMQGTSAELLAQEWSLTREALDAYALESHRRAIAAMDEGRLESEIVAIEPPGGTVRRFAATAPCSLSTRRRGDVARSSPRSRPPSARTAS
jgi:acetyl-CoA acetyltransferase